MRLLIAVLSPDTARRIAAGMEIRGFDALIAPNGTQALKLLLRERFDLLILHACLPELDGFEVLEALAALHHPCPPRVLFLCEPELCASRPALADAVAPICATPEKLCALLETLAQKPLPKLAAAQAPRTAQAVDTFLSAISMDRRYKGRAYAAWLLEHLAPSPVLEERSMGQLYRSCARAFGTTPTAVERCLRVAVESVFTQGSMRGIERFFGATVDPERGKPTNRAFLLQASQQIRLDHSLADTRSPNSSEMHHSPAAPTRV